MPPPPHEFSAASMCSTAPTSPTRHNPGKVFFQSVPTSPMRRVSSATFDFESTPITSKTSEVEDYNVESSDCESSDYDFDSEISEDTADDEYPQEGVMDEHLKVLSRFRQRWEDVTGEHLQEATTTGESSEEEKMQDKDKKHQKTSSIPVMEFDHDQSLSHEEKQTAMPLKLPPCRQFSNVATHRWPNRHRILFPRRRISSFLNSDFDPFMVALENVKEEKNGDHRGGDHHRRVQSTSCLMGENDLQSPELTGQSRTHKQLRLIASSDSIQVPDETTKLGSENPMPEIPKAPIKLAESKGVVLARKARLVGIAQQWPRKHHSNSFPLGMAGNSNSRENKRQRMKSTNQAEQGGEFFPWPPIDENENISKSTHANEGNSVPTDLKIPKPKVTKKKSLKSMAYVPFRKDRKMLSPVSYKPKLLLCMGYGKLAKKIAKSGIK